MLNRFLRRVRFDFLGPRSPAVRSAAEFKALVEQHRETADRYGFVFSIVVFDVPLAIQANGFPEKALLALLSRRLRLTDEIGRVGTRELGVLLPHTSREGARAVTEDLLQNADGALTLEMISSCTFPDDWTKCNEEWEAPPAQLRRLVYRERPLWKVSLDMTGASIALILLSPIMLITALLVRATSEGPALYRQRRVGLGGAPFDFYKFRTMRVDADDRKHELLRFNERKGPVFKIKKDPRITSIGRILRRWSLDELPQLLNVLKGDMSLVGPRPLPVTEVKRHSPWHRRRLDLTPGITGLWQVEARADPDYDNWVRLDINYLRRRSLALDLWILVRTIPAVLSGRGAC